MSMADALTVHEVSRYVREAIGSLYRVELPPNAHPGTRQRIDRALAALNELQFLCELTLNVDAGVVVIVDHDDERST
jgi:hypothetical protein